MATQTRALLTLGRRLSPHTRRVSHLAGQPGLFEAQRWFSRERSWINERHLQLCRIAAPTFFEQKRAEWLCNQLKAIGWDARIDRAGNTLATYENEGDTPVLAVTAHLDTVLAPARPEDIVVTPDGRLTGPGVSDNGSGLAALLALARVLVETPDLADLARSVLLIANVGEEGEGNLSGMRYICGQTPLLARIAAFVVLDGPSIEHVTAQALASRRFEIGFTGPGGHSWNDQGSGNPVHALAMAITSFGQAADTRIASANPTRCSYNFGVIEGGSSINSIAASARAKLDLRSEESTLLDELTSTLTFAVERALEHQNRAARTGRLAAKIKELGSRPGGRLSESSAVLQTIHAVDAYLNIRSRIDCASTDANIPLSLGLPAISIGTGGQGGGAHSSQEWFLPDGRELGLRRILLLLASLHTQLESSGAFGSAREF
ncbi:MAG: M20/M25/M40 family metallo-hydrolase [Bryobacteraceae bacterium]